MRFQLRKARWATRRPAGPEKVAYRMEGKKEYEVLSRETLYYSRTVWATSKDEAETICEEENDWGEVTDSSDFMIDETKEA